MDNLPNKKFEDNTYTWIKTYEKYKEQFSIVSDMDISNCYKIAKEHFQNLANNSLYTEITKALKFEERNSTKKGKTISGVSARLDEQINIWVNQIKNAKVTEIEKFKKSNTTTINQDIAKKLKAKWENMIALVGKQQWGNLNTEMKKMQGYLDALNAELERNSAGLIDLQNVLGEGDAYAITSRLEGTLSRIQGEILEQEVQRFLINKIPHQVVVTGSVTSADGGKIKPDLVVALDNLELKNQDGQTTYRFRNGDIYNTENVKQTENISLTSYEIKSLNAGTIGFSAKTTSGRPTFHQGYNINQLIEDSIKKGDPTSALYQLMHFYQLGLQNVPNITTYQRYAVARLAIQIMGQNNAFIITKNEIIPTWQYMEKLMHRGGLYFANNKIPARANTDVLNSKFGSTNIVGQTV